MAIDLEGGGEDDDFEIPEDATRTNFDIEEAYGAAIKPMGVGDGFGAQPCEQGHDAVLWHFATPDEVDALQKGGGEVKAKDTKGSRRKTKFQIDPDSTVYNPFGGGGAFEEIEEGVLVGIHVCLDDNHMPLASGWEMDWPLYYRRGGYTLDETVAYQVWRDPDVQSSDPKLREVLDPLEQLGIEEDTDFKWTQPGEAQGSAPSGEDETLGVEPDDDGPDEPDPDGVELPGGEPDVDVETEPEPEPDPEPVSPGTSPTQPSSQRSQADIAAEIEQAIEGALEDVDIDFRGEYTTPEGDQGSFSGTLGEGGGRSRVERVADEAEREADLSEYTEFSRWCLSGGDRSASLCGDVWQELKTRGVAPAGTDAEDDSGDDTPGEPGDAAGDDDATDGRAAALADDGDDGGAGGIDLAAAAQGAAGGAADPFSTAWTHGQDVVLTREKCIACQRLKERDDIQDALESGALIEVTPSHPDYEAIVDQMDVETLPALGAFDAHEGDHGRFIRYDDNA